MAWVFARVRTFRRLALAVAVLAALLLMCRSFFVCDYFALCRPDATWTILSGNGFFSVRYVSMGARSGEAGSVHQATRIPFGLAAFEDESLFGHHFKRSFDGFDWELGGLRVVASSTDERRMGHVQVPEWAPVAALSFLALSGPIGGALRAVRRRAGRGYEVLGERSAGRLGRGDAV
ncbi:MAG: hypothetical protein ACTHN5_10630 [Phycisphaerae bacterium]